MEFRLGTCTNCKNSFRVPASFTAAKAKCPKCQGVVEIGPVQGAAPAAAASSEAPKPVPASVPPARPAPAAGTPKPAVPAPAPQPAAQTPKAPAPKPAAPAASKPAPSAKPAAPAPKPAAAAARPAAKESVRSAAESAAKRVKGKGDDGDGGSRRGRGSHGPKQKNWGALLGALGFLIVLGGGAFWYFGYRLPAEHAAAKERAEAESLAVAPAQPSPESAGASTGAPDAPKEPEAQTPASTDPEATTEEAAAKKPEPEKAAEQAKEPETSKPTEVVDLSAIPDLERLAGTSDEDWKKYQDLVKTMLDPNAGAKSSRAANQLVEIGKPAFPAILNGFKRLDLATDDGFRMADMTQKTLERLCNGNNFGWLYQHQKDYLNYDKKAIKAWIGAWERAKDDEDFWLKLTKQDKKPAEGEGEAKSGSGLDDF